MKTQKNATFMGIFTVFAIFGFLFAACGDPESGPTGGNTVSVTGVTLNKTVLSLPVDGTETLTATVTPSDASNKAVRWSSSDTSKATVDANGKVTAKVAGTTKITVTTVDGGFTADCNVTIRTVGPGEVPVTSVTLDNPAISLAVGDSQTLTATVVPGNATIKTVSWTSNATAIATVDANGKVEAKAVGTAKITVTTTDGGKTAECTVTVTKAPVSIAITTPPTKTLYKTGEELDLTGLVVTATYSDGSTGTVNITTEHISGFNPNTVGEQILTINYGGKETTFTVTVVGLSSITITTPPTKTRYAIDETLDLTGLVVTAVYSDETDEVINHDKLSISGFDSASAGTKTLTVSYGGQTQSFTVTVFAVVTFNPNGGNWNGDTTNKTIEVDQIATITKPDDPVKDDLSFGGWYRDSNFGTEWNFASNTVTGNITLYAAWMTLDDADFGQGASINNTFNISNLTEWNDALYTISGSGNDKNYIINIIDSFYIPGSTSNTFGSTNGIKVSIRGEGQTLNLSSNGSILSITAYQTVILWGLSLKGRNSNNASLVYVYDGTFIMNSGEISGNTNASNGGGVLVSNGTFTMNGGKIFGNTATNGNGGGVYFVRGTSTINGGEISGNTGGGGIYFYGGSGSQSGTVNMYGGKISNNAGNGVSMDGSVTFIMYGGEISNNIGIGLSNSNGIFTMYDGKISDNESNGIVFTGNLSRTFTMYDGEISGNAGYGVDVESFTMYDGEISGNAYCGVSAANFIMNGGEISCNGSPSYTVGGVGVYGTFIMNAGKISGNTASYGGGVYVGSSGTFTMNGGEIFSNTASTSGGGVYVSGTFRISTGTIYGSGEGTNSNTATSGAAVFRDTSGMIQYGTFSGSTWNSNGVLNTTNNTIRVVEGMLQQ